MIISQKRKIYFITSQNKFLFFETVIRCLVFLLSCLIISTIPFIARAATIYLAPAEGEFSPGETFIEEIKLDTEGEDINAIEVNLGFPGDILEIVDFSDGGSLLKIWVDKPIINDSQETINKYKGTLSFTGGVPNGFTGEGTLGKVVFKARALSQGKMKTLPREAKIQFLAETQLLLNDGQGTLAKLTKKGSILQIIAEKSEILGNEWQSIIKEDDILPEFFEIKISRESSMFEGKYFISFLAVDEQSGIDHYEIQEGDGEWQEATSPYVLQDQSLKSIIRVKAIDKAGNEKIEILNPSGKSIIDWFVLTVFLVIIGWMAYRNIKHQTIEKPK